MNLRALLRSPVHVTGTALPSHTNSHISTKTTHYRRAVFRTTLLVGLLCLFALASHFHFTTDTSSSHLNDHTHRHLNSIFPPKASPQWHLIFYIIGTLYTFLALAIICDEYFVPALEHISSQWHLRMDVSGATLMAAGGSTPELFTSMIGTFRKSDIGFGTIVGSAVFNVLFVIGMCSLCSHETLTLHSWPILRDVFCYVVALVTLVLFVGVISKGEVYWWEAGILLGLYGGYIMVMVYNGTLYQRWTGQPLTKEDDKPTEEHTHEMDFRFPGMFRASALQLLRDPHSWMKTAAGISLVARIAGTVEETFHQCDLNGDGYITPEELDTMMQKLDLKMSPAEIQELFTQLDTNCDGSIDSKEFTSWYVSSEKFLQEHVRTVFDTFDTDHSQSIDRHELRQLLDTMEPNNVTESDIDLALQACSQTEPMDQITFPEFLHWYSHSLLYKKSKEQLQLMEQEKYPTCNESFQPPAHGSHPWAYIQYLLLLPLVVIFACTVPDTRKPHLSRYALLSFFLSILWIGIFSYFMVGWAETIGHTLGIPSFIMGLTFLAAGTSVPDLLSSVIVAKRGYGDMAVSSSIGSNIFDILVGLPLPWMIYILWPSTENIVKMDSKGIWVSICILLGMLVLVVLCIHCQGWKLTRRLGGCMFVLYGLFLVQAIVMEYFFGT